ncbi:MAG: hypothetical protein LT071_11595 [Nocardioides sp.]|nr:hypothetical protein [Nocardioides sp.]
MQLRRSLATATAVLALAAPLSGCGIRGFDYPTERVYTPGAGTNNTSGDVDVLSAVVVSGTEDQGTLIVTLVNGSEEERTLQGLSGKRVVTSEGVEPTPVEFAEFEPVAVEPGQSVNFAEPALEITLTGTFAAGNFLEVTFEFDDGERVTMSVPVVEDEGSDWAGLDAS